MSREHYLPAGLGSFRGYEPLLHRVCEPCNRQLGRLDEVLLRTGITGFLRHLAGVMGQDGPPPSPFERGAGGVPPMEMPGAVPGLAEPLLMAVRAGTRDAEPMGQIVLESPTGERRAHRITARMREQPDILIRELRERGLAAARPVGAVAPTSDIPWVNELMRALGAAPPDEWEPLDVPPQQVQLAATVTMAEPYFRAIAKMAFHYTLKMFPALTGHEQEFDRIKDYIWTGAGGGRHRPVQTLPNQFWELPPR